jgi:hypothetical protein
VCVEVMARGVLRVLGSVHVMCVRYVGVMRSLLVVACFVMLRRLRMMMRGHAVMMGGLAVLVHCLL